MDAAQKKIDVVSTGAALGAEIRGIDLSKDLDSSAIATIMDAWAKHLVLLIRGQQMTDEQFLQFGKHFGDLDLAPLDTMGRPFFKNIPEMLVISNVIENGVAIGGLGNYESFWHTDMSYTDVPPRASLLYALEVPPAGGDTGFCNMYLAYETLPDDLRKAVGGRVAIHDATYNSAGEIRKGYSHVTDPTQAPGAKHPLVRIHPVTGRKALFLGRRRNSYVVGMPVPESEQLLDRLWAHATDQKFTWAQKWRVGDLVIWDNRCVMHRRDEFDQTSRRVMHRLQVKGEPVRGEAVGSTT